MFYSNAVNIIHSEIQKSTNKKNSPSFKRLQYVLDVLPNWGKKSRKNKPNNFHRQFFKIHF